MSVFEFTTAQLDKTVELFRILLDHSRIGAVSVSEPHNIRTPLGVGRLGCPLPTDDHVRALTLSDGERVVRTDADGHDEIIDPVEITLISYSDYHGSDIDAANVRALARMPGVAVTQRDFRDDGGRAEVRLGEMSAFANAQNELPDLDDAIMWLSRLVDVMNKTLDSTYIDDETHVEYLIELADAAWDSWIRLDLPQQLCQLAHDIDLDVPDDARDANGALYETTDLDGYVRDLFATRVDDFRAVYYDFEGSDWVAENAVSVTNARHDDAIRHAAHTVFGWPVNQ